MSDLDFNDNLFFQKISIFIEKLESSLENSKMISISNSEYLYIYNKIVDFGLIKTREKLQEFKLLNYFKNCLVGYLHKNIINLINDSYLSKIVIIYFNYVYFANWIIKLFKSLEINYLRQKTKLEEISFFILKDKFIEMINFEFLREKIFDSLNKYRKNKIFNSSSQLLNAIQIFKILCLTKNIKIKENSNDCIYFYYGEFENQIFYIEYFEKQYIDYISHYYDNVIINIIENHDISKYLNECIYIFELEKDLSDKFYPESWTLIKKNLNEILILKNCQKVLYNINGGLLNLLEFDKINDLSNCFKIFGDFEIIIKNYISKIFEDFIIKFSNDIISSLKLQLNEINNKESKQKITEKQISQETINNFIKLKELIFEKLKIFNNNLIIKNSISLAFSKIFLDNELSTYLVNYFHILLCNKVDSQIMAKLTILLDFFSNILNKDEFIDCYKNRLIFRIIYDNLKLKEIELDIIKYFRMEMGLGNTIVFNEIFNDYENSKELENEFKMINKNLEFNFSIKIFRKSLSRIFDSPAIGDSKINRNFIEKFTVFYENKMKKKIVFLNIGISEMSFKNNKLLLFNEDIYILDLFNRNNKLTYEDIINQINISKFKIKSKLNLFVEKDIIVFNDGYYSVNIKYKNKSGFVNLTFKSNYDDIDTKNNINPKKSNIIKDRESLIEVNIVKIMKSNIKILYSEVFIKINQLLHHLFYPDQKMFKMRIESLIERKYIMRDENNNNFLIYLP